MARSNLPAKATAWDKGIARLRKQRDSLAGGILQYRYATGQFALAVSEDLNNEEGKRKYGSHTVGDIAAELQESPSTIYSCITFVNQVTPDELKQLIEKGWAWRAVTALLTVEDPKKRKKLQQQYERGKYKNSDELRQEIKATNKAAVATGQKREKRGSRSGDTIGQRIRGLVTVSTTLLTQAAPEFAEGIKAYLKAVQEMPPDAADKIMSDVAKMQDLLPDLRLTLDRIEQLIARTGL